MSTREERLRERAAKKEQRLLRAEARKERTLARKAAQMARPKAVNRPRVRSLPPSSVAIGIPTLVSRSMPIGRGSNAGNSSRQAQRTGASKPSMGTATFGSGRGEPHTPQANHADAHQKARALMEAMGKGLRDRPESIPHALPWRVS